MIWAIRGQSAIPSDFVRSFNRLAALLESADIEFDRLKSELLKYEEEVPSLIVREPESVLINQASLESFSNTNLVIKKVATLIANDTGSTIYADTDFEGIISRFTLFKIVTIKDLDGRLKETEGLFLSFVSEFIKGLSKQRLPSSITLYYFQHFLAAMTQDPEFVRQYFDYEYPNIGSENDAASNFVEIFKKSKAISAN